MPRILKGRKHNLNLKRRFRSEMTPAERELWSRLRGQQFQGLKFRRQHGVGPYLVDFYCPARALVIEVDGDSHADEYQTVNDEQRDAFLNSLGLEVLRYANDEIHKNLDGVLEDLSRRLS